jgi:hypothetical protein
MRNTVDANGKPPSAASTNRQQFFPTAVKLESCPAPTTGLHWLLVLTQMANLLHRVHCLRCPQHGCCRMQQSFQIDRGSSVQNAEEKRRQALAVDGGDRPQHLHNVCSRGVGVCS